MTSLRVSLFMRPIQTGDGCPCQGCMFNSFGSTSSVATPRFLVGVVQMSAVGDGCVHGETRSALGGSRPPRIVDARSETPVLRHLPFYRSGLSTRLSRMQRHVGGIVLLVTLALGASGCGGGSDADAGNASDGGTSPPVDGSVADGSSGSDAGAGSDGGSGSDAGDALDAGGSVDGSVDGGSALTVEEFCAGYRDGLCTWDQSCRSMNDACNFPIVSDLAATCAAFPARMEAGVVIFDPDAAARCLAQDFSVCGMVRPFETEACNAAFMGTVAPGGDCYQVDHRAFDNECVATAFCDESSSCPGVCVAYGGVGDACGAGHPPCGATTGCSDGTCAPRPVEGESCASLPCASPYSCVDSVCRTLVGVGESCDATHPCTYALICAGGTCADTVGSGDACTNSAQCPTDEQCYGPSGSPICQAPIALGDPCGGLIRGCVSGASCFDVSGGGTPDYRCVAPGGNGGPCTVLGCANGFWCRYGGAGDSVDGTCRPLGGPSNPCASTMDAGGPRCITDYYCIDDVCSGPSAEGGGCNLLGSCQSGLWCDGSSVCATPAARGEACSTEWADSCGPDDYCSWDTNLCVALGLDGSLCSTPDQCASGGCAPDSTGVFRCGAAPPPPTTCTRP